MSTQEQNPSSMLKAPNEKSRSQLLEGEQLKRATNHLVAKTVERIMAHQNGVPTFCDSNLLDLVRRLLQLDKKLPWEESVEQLGGEAGILKEALHRLRLYLLRQSQGRFVDFRDRFADAASGLRSQSDIGVIESALSQGGSECMRWKGRPLFKTVFDFSLYTMILWDLKPRTIIELGSGTGASAIWMADMMKALDVEGHVYSVDLKKLALDYEGVTYIQGDCMKIGTVFEAEFLKAAPHPWLLIEDAHVNVCGVLSHFHPYLLEGEYIVVEDSINPGELEEILRFMNEHPDRYKVDTYYTDFFGRNATCAMDSILVKMQ